MRIKFLTSVKRFLCAVVNMRENVVFLIPGTDFCDSPHRIAVNNNRVLYTVNIFAFASHLLFCKGGCKRDGDNEFLDLFVAQHGRDILAAEEPLVHDNKHWASVRDGIKLCKGRFQRTYIFQAPAVHGLIDR